jgi:hypothetical protein
MTNGELAYLVMILVAMGVFALSLFINSIGSRNDHSSEH